MKVTVESSIKVDAKRKVWVSMEFEGDELTNELLVTAAHAAASAAMKNYEKVDAARFPVGKPKVDPLRAFQDD